MLDSDGASCAAGTTAGAGGGAGGPGRDARDFWEADPWRRPPSGGEGWRVGTTIKAPLLHSCVTVEMQHSGTGAPHKAALQGKPPHQQLAGPFQETWGP